MKSVTFSRASWWLLGACVLFFVAVSMRLALLHHAFALDDFKIIVANDFISHGKNALILFDPRYLFHPYPIACGARPLTVFSLMIDYHFWGLDPFGYHLFNIALHACNTILVFAVAGICAVRFNPDYPFVQQLILSMVAGLVFCLHPLQTEAIAIASFRADLLATFFSLAAIAGFCCAVTVSSGIGRAIGMAAAAGCLILGLLSKEIAVSIPLVMILAVLTAREMVSKRAAGWFAMVGAVTAVLYLLVFWLIRVDYPFSTSVFPALAGTHTPLYSIGAYINIVVAAWIHHWMNILAPVRLSADYQMVVLPSLMIGRCLVAGSIVLILCGIVWRMRSKLFLFGIGMFVITYLPVSNIVPLINTMNDRYLYLPMAGIALAIAALFARLHSFRPYAGMGAAACLIIWYGVATIVRQPVFATDNAIYAEAVQRAPENVRVRYNRGISLMVHNDFSGALMEFGQVLRLNPSFKPYEVRQSIIDCAQELGMPPTAGKAVRASDRKGN